MPLSICVFSMLQTSPHKTDDTIITIRSQPCHRSPSEPVCILKLLMEQHALGVSDLPEIGTKSLISRILSGQRQLTKDHITILSKRFNISPALFF